MKQVAMLLSNAFRPDPRVLKEASSLAAYGYKLTIICWDRAAELLAQEPLKPDIQVIRIQNIPSEYGIGARQIFRLPWFWLALQSHLNHLKPDLIHCHDFDTLPAGLLWGKLHRKPVIYDAHEYYADLCKPRLYGLTGGILYRMIRFAELKGARMASAVVTVDDRLGAIYRRQNHIVKIVGHYPPRKFITETGKVFSRDHLSMIYSGRLSYDRGLNYYIQLLGELIARNIPARLHLVGAFTPKSEQEWIERAPEHLSPKISFHGWVDYAELPELLSSADLGLAVLMPEPRYVDAVPVKLFEYMAAGLPVVASNFPPIAEVIGETESGIMVDPLGDPGDVAKQLAEWWANPETPQRLGSSGQLAIQHKYNWEQLSAQLDELYRFLLN